MGREWELKPRVFNGEIHMAFYTCSRSCLAHGKSAFDAYSPVQKETLRGLGPLLCQGSAKARKRKKSLNCLTADLLCLAV